MPDTQDQTASVDIAAMLAKEGIKTDDSPVFVPAQNNTPAQEEKPKETQPVADNTETVQTPPGPPTTPEPPKAEPPRTDSVKVEPAAGPERVVEQARPAEIDWREVLKKQPENEVLQAIGLDEKMINFLSRWKGGEDLKDYLEAISIDYTKMSPEEVLRRQLSRDYRSLSTEDFEEVYKMMVTEKYKLDPDLFDEKEVRRGRLMLGIEADKVRQEFIKQQQDLLLSKPPAPGPSIAEQEAQAQQQQRQQEFETYKGLVNNHEQTKQLLSTKLLKIGEGDKAFNLEVANPNEVLDLLYDPGKWAQKLWNEDGTPNIRKQLLLGAIAYDDQAFFSNWAKHYEMLGAKNVTEKIQNASEPTPGTTTTGNGASADPIAQLARFGTIVSGD